MRVTEALLFASNLYTDMGVAPETHLSVRVTHCGLKGRQLQGIGSRYISPHRTEEDQSQAEIVVAVGEIKKTLVENVKRITEPLFMLFDFSQFAPEIYEDIVRRFEQGEVT